MFASAPVKSGQRRNAMTNPASDLAKLRKRVDHLCPICGVTFKAIKTAKFCSNACRQKAKYQRDTQSNR